MLEFVKHINYVIILVRYDVGHETIFYITVHDHMYPYVHSFTYVHIRALFEL